MACLYANRNKTLNSLPLGLFAAEGIERRQQRKLKKKINAHLELPFIY